jgi:hypothetical protein
MGFFIFELLFAKYTAQFQAFSSRLFFFLETRSLNLKLFRAKDAEIPQLLVACARVDVPHLYRLGRLPLLPAFLALFRAVAALALPIHVATHGG